MNRAAFNQHFLIDCLGIIKPVWPVWVKIPESDLMSTLKCCDTIVDKATIWSLP